MLRAKHDYKDTGNNADWYNDDDDDDDDDDDYGNNDNVNAAGDT